MARFTVQVNGNRLAVESPPDRPLLDVLREDFGLTGTKYGCGEGQCRACTVLVDGQPTASCLTPISSVDGTSVTTIEGLAPGDQLTALQQAFIDMDGAQCGYCTAGMIVEATALLKRNRKPSRSEIVDAMNPHLCRCCGYRNILASVELGARASEASDA
ncbi:MAG: (2Fe-2S)-binding protein [Bryobacterales bacterium]|nr:(2Fe-2S)-binding protein [Bryobacterales bacterium]MDE0261498.1 (2Fe-2S)-binding protein [Bryobacterales bacterium]